ncbi:hypothetical protein AVEN_262188-1 [Araneus ventricosus]|uniref:Uncharacterized protein n=1 Tax=Araneus ventricosus TaxID=182803 RepID=A0A4Y2RF93_ARAVE|nr:hypothetical protein AVEN_262188-1 [Araneus ventricosus]
MAGLRRLASFESRAFTKANNKVEELIALEDADISQLNVLKVDRLEITHASILELLSEKEFEAEFDVVKDFRDKAVRIEIKARRIINYQQHNVSTVLHSTHSDSAIFNSAENAVIEKRRFKLPELELRKFDGVVKEWLYFWSQFEKNPC